jgi:subtilase family serine protease
MKLTRSTTIAVALLGSLTAIAAPAPHRRITGRIDNSHRMTLRGEVHPLARSANDEGRAEATLEIPNVTLVLRPSDEQQADLDRLLAAQQDPSSPEYHHWLTPEQYADRFGVAQEDIEQMKTWLQAQNLTVISVARGRNAISFSGPAAAIEQAFGTKIHRYRVDGELHFANSTDPTIPAAMQNVVSSIHGLHDFAMKSRAVHPVQAQYNSLSSSAHYLAPDDMATIFNVRSLYNSGIDGTGQKIVVVGQTQINLSDIQQFRTYFNLPANDPQVMLVPDTRDPGIRRGDLQEADLDLEWAGAIARNATLIYVYSRDVMDAVQYAIDQNVAPVISMSYGLCETLTSQSDAATQRSWAKQASAQGISWIAASGDSGGADCYDGSSRTPSGLAVDLPAALPEVTGIGGTQLSDSDGNFWNTSNDANRASALSYIPEAAWNDSVLAGSPSSSGGGASTFFAKPDWQTGNGVPNDNARDVPDVSLPASPSHDGYIFFTGGRMGVVGGTSAGAPAFAGIAALLNHYLTSNGTLATPGVGNMNPRLYSLAAASSSVFHDVTKGDNLVTACTSSRFRTCTADPVGFSAGAGYDQVTGLGSIDAYNLVTSW